MGTFSVADQDITMGSILVQDDQPVSSLPITGISFRSSDATAHCVVMELRIDPVGEVMGYELTFNRNGEFVPPVKPVTKPPTSEAAAMTVGTTSEDEEDHSTSRSHGRRR